MASVQVRWLLVAPGLWLLRLMHGLLGKQLLLACEVAMEYLLALTHSPHVRLLPSAIYAASRLIYLITQRST